MGRVGTTTLIGRDGEFDALRRALRAAAAGQGQVVLIEGEAGIGKTRVAQEAAALAEERGFDVREGHCDDVERARPFAPLAGALGLTLASADPDRRAIAELLSGDDTASALSISGKQFRVIELVGALVEKLAESRPLLLLVEDLHWADGSTLAALRSIARRTRQLPVVLVATSRPGFERDELYKAIDSLLRDGATHLALGPLAADEVAALATELLDGEPSAELLERLQGATGNPLFVREFIEAVADANEAEGMPDEFRHAVLRRVGQLSEDTNRVLRVAAVLGSTFSAADLALALDETPLQLSSLLQQAISSRIIGERGERMAFRHDLVRDAIYEHIPRDLRRDLHRHIGEALAAGAADPLVVAHHLAMAAESHDERAADWLLRAALDMRQRAPGVAVELLERALELLPAASPARGGILTELVMPLAWSGRLADAEALALELLAQRPPPEVAGPLRCGLVYALMWQGRATEALAYTEVDDDEPLLEPDAVLLSAEGAVARFFASSDLPKAAQQAAAAEIAARAIGHDLALCHALTIKSVVLNFMQRLTEAVEVCREAIDVADRSAHGEGHLAHPRFFPGMPLMNLDRVDEAQAVLQRGRAISEELGMMWALPLYHSHIGGGRFIIGEWDSALAELETCLSLSDEHGLNVGMVAAAGAWKTVIHVRRGDLDVADRTMREALARQSGALVGFGLLTWARAVLAEAKGNLAEALDILETAWQAFLGAGAVSSDPWTAMALVRFHVKAGNRERASAVAEAMEARAQTAESASTRALPLRCRGLADANLDVLLEALAAYRESGRRVDLADTLVDVGFRLIDEERAGDAESYLDEAMDIYEDIGAARDTAQLRADLRARGITRGTRRRHSRASSGWASLTETELKVVALVAQRMSNPEVAERLFVSRYTVESHLKNIYRKLSIGSRGELATAAAERSEAP